MQWREEFNGSTTPSGWALGDWWPRSTISTHNMANVSFVNGIAVLSHDRRQCDRLHGNASRGYGGGGASGTGGTSGAGGTAGSSGAAGTSGAGTGSGGTTGGGGAAGAAERPAPAAHREAAERHRPAALLRPAARRERPEPPRPAARRERPEPPRPAARRERPAASATGTAGTGDVTGDRPARQDRAARPATTRPARGSRGNRRRSGPGRLDRSNRRRQRVLLRRQRARRGRARRPAALLARWRFDDRRPAPPIAARDERQRHRAASLGPEPAGGPRPEARH